MPNKRNNLNEYKWDVFFDEFQKESPRAAVIISGAFLDTLLRDLLASFMIEGDDAVDELLGTDKYSETPLGSFGARIKTAYCLGLISKVEYNDLKQIKNIRNKLVALSSGDLTKALQGIVVMHQSRCNNRQAEPW